MNRLFGLLTRLRRAFQRRAMDQQLLAEMKDHLERETARRIALGEDPATARRRAAVEFGSVDARTEEVREQRLGAWWDETWRNLRYAWRGLRHSPGFTFVSVATIAVGIGAATAVFSLVDAILLRPLPVPAPSELGVTKGSCHNLSISCRYRHNMVRNDVGLPACNRVANHPAEAPISRCS